MTKQAEYMELVAARKACDACPGLTNPADVDGGCHDSDSVGPWSQWQGSLDAKLMVIGQRPPSLAYFLGECRTSAGHPTNLHTVIHLERHQERLRGSEVAARENGAVVYETVLVKVFANSH